MNEMTDHNHKFTVDVPIWVPTSLGDVDDSDEISKSIIKKAPTRRITAESVSSSITVHQVINQCLYHKIHYNEGNLDFYNDSIIEGLLKDRARLKQKKKNLTQSKPMSIK